MSHVLGFVQGNFLLHAGKSLVLKFATLFFQHICNCIAVLLTLHLGTFKKQSTWHVRFEQIHIAQWHLERFGRVIFPADTGAMLVERAVIWGGYDANMLNKQPGSENSTLARDFQNWEAPEKLPVSHSPQTIFGWWFLSFAIFLPKNPIQFDDCGVFFPLCGTNTHPKQICFP